MDYQICHLALDEVYQAYLLGVSYDRALKRLILQSSSSVGKVRHMCFRAGGALVTKQQLANWLVIKPRGSQARWRRHALAQFHALAKRGSGFGFGLGPVPRETQLRRQQRAYLIVVLKISTD